MEGSDNEENNPYYEIKSEFEMISIDDFHASVKTLKKEESDDLIRSSLILDSDEKNLPTIWDSISNLGYNIRYNLLNLNSNSRVDYSSLRYIRLFDFLFSDQIKSSHITKFMDTVLLFTYRSGFSPIKNSSGKEFITDCGWGCMIRSAQMMLARAILEMKINKHAQDTQQSVIDVKKYFASIDEGVLNKLKFDTLLLFFDNSLKIEDIATNEDFAFFIESYSKIISTEKQKEHDITKSIEDLSDQLLSNVQCLDKESSILYAKDVIPPFSIQNICNVAEKFQKEAGVWFSDQIMIKIFIEINKHFKTIQNVEMMHFAEGLIDEKVLLDACFDEIKCDISCKNNFITEEEGNNISEDQSDYFNMLQFERNDIPICLSCEEMFFLRSESNHMLALKKGNRLFKFKKGGIIFLSVRLGLDAVDNSYVETIPLLFQIPNNIGIIGGKTNSAYYFIGECPGKLVYLDPHLNQGSISDKNGLRIDTNFITYKPSNAYQIDIQKISPAFTIGFYFRSVGEYHNLIELLSIHSIQKYPVLKFKEYIG